MSKLKLYNLNMYNLLYVNYTTIKLFKNDLFLAMKMHPSFLQIIMETSPKLHMLLDGREIKLMTGYSGNSLGPMT